MTSDTRVLLPWSLAFDRTEDAPPLFHEAVATALASVDAETFGTFALIPNFRFNHTGFHPDTVEDLYLGTLTATLATAESGPRVAQSDSTSGEAWVLSIDSPSRTLEADAAWRVDSVAEGNTMIFEGQVDDSDDGWVVRGRLGRGTRALACTHHGRRVLHRPTLFLGLADLADRDFDLIDLSHGYEHGLRVHQVDATTQPVGGIDTSLACFAVAGRNSIPTYWWVDPADRVVAMSGTLWTYVLIRPELIP